MKPHLVDDNTPPAGQVDQAEASPAVAELVQLASATDAELDGTPPAAGQPPQPPVDRGAELGAMLQMVVAIATPLLPFLPQCYTEDTCRQIGTAFAAVANKYGWDLDLANCPELALAIVTIPPTVNAVALGRAHFEAKRREASSSSSSSSSSKSADQAQQLQTV